MRKQHDVIVVGGTCCDLIFSGLPSMPRLGEEVWAEGMELTVGGMMNTAAALSRLGLKVGLISETGTDIWGNIIAEKMREEGVDPQFLQVHQGPYPQITVAINYQNDRSFVSYAAKHRQDAYKEHLTRMVRQSEARIYHFSAQREYIEAIREAKKLNKRISLDVAWDEDWLKNPELRSIIGLADIFLPNWKEAEVITGKSDPYEALEELAQLAPVVVVKMGERGAICKAGGKVYSTEAFAANVVDSTGAGDCFVAGFLYGWLQNRSIEECLKSASYCGSKCVEAVGGYTGVPTLGQLMKDLPFMSPIS